VPYKNAELRVFADGESKIRLDNIAKRIASSFIPHTLLQISISCNCS